MPAPVEITNESLKAHQGDAPKNKCKFCGQPTNEAIYCSKECYQKQYRNDNREMVNSRERDRRNKKSLEERGGVERIKCSNPDCGNLARSNRKNATCSAKCDMIIYHQRHPKKHTGVTNICALDGCDKLARSNKTGSTCCVAHLRAYERRQKASADGREYSTKIGRRVKPPVVVIRVCACGCGQTFETPKRADSRHQRRYVDKSHIGRHKTQLAKDSKAAGLSKAKKRECACGCGQTFFISEYPSRKYAPGCTNKVESVFSKPAKKTPPPAPLKPGTHAPYANTYVQLKNMPETSRREQARIDKIVRASKLPGYNKHTPDRFIRMLSDE